MRVIRAVEKTVCQTPGILEEIETDLKTTYKLFLMTIKL